MRTARSSGSSAARPVSRSRSAAAITCALGATLLMTATVSPWVSAAALEPLIYGWEQFFTLDWQPGERKGQPVVYGRIGNTWGMPAANIRLLVEGFDTAGAPLAQKVEWLGTQLPPGVRAYFEVPAPTTAATYRVRVFAFDWVQSGNGSDRR